ncbi:NnrS family protein [Chitinibacter bivalviorum]|uniref:NnrS family protein n=1 Tax=Chitinibacter bivalviorum TaxID=2739434 RepID=A0A7H9BGB5_9NEIS|nr:NnrS family protein [Chitinibacter bivalviorum]QLG87763.1 NnrS family protein [Chitinibacter bivalviorum]
MSAQPAVYLRTLTSAPHRLGFLAGSILLLLSFLFWGVEIAARGWLNIQAEIPAMFWHGYVMTYAFFPLFMLGFIYTAGPRWLNVQSPTLKQYAPVLLVYACGGVACLAGRWFSGLMIFGIALHFLAWLLAISLWWLAISRSKVLDKQHAIAVGLAFCMGSVGMGAALYWIATAQIGAWAWAINIGIWGFLLPVFLVVSHRMIPFFSGNAIAPYSPWRPMGLLYTMGGLLLVRIVIKGFQVNTLAVDALLAAGLMYTSWRWQLLRSFQVKLLAMLHAAFFWAGIALALFTIGDVLQMFDLPSLGFAPLHALTLGFFCTMLLGFVTRVTLGHSGRPLMAGGVAWVAYWAMHGVALARVLGEMIPVWQSGLYLLAALSAIVALLSWGKVYMPMYWQARIDGQKG